MNPNAVNLTDTRPFRGSVGAALAAYVPGGAIERALQTKVNVSLSCLEGCPQAWALPSVGALVGQLDGRTLILAAYTIEVRSSVVRAAAIQLSSAPVVEISANIERVMALPAARPGTVFVVLENKLVESA